MNLSLYIARRYTISRSKSTAVNIITGIAALGIVVSATALFVILSVFTGLRDFSLSFTNVTDPDLKITPALGKSFLLLPKQEQQIKAIEGVASYSKVAEERVLFYFDGKEQVAYLKGVDSLFTKVSPVAKQLVAGKWFKPETSQVVVGIGTANKLSLGLFDFNHALEVYVPRPGKGTIDNAEDAFNKSALVPMGVYSVNDDVNSKYVYCDLGLAQELLQFRPSQLTALEVKLNENVPEGSIRKKLNALFNDKVIIKNRAQLNDSLYKMLNSENLVVYLFCSLVVVMTLFCLAGALIMLIIDKRENIRTLFNLGAEAGSLRKIFLFQGIFITAIGGGSGLAIGSLVIFIQQRYQLIMITDNLAFPVVFDTLNIVIVILTIFLLGFLASLIASGRVNKKLLENS